MTERGSIYTYVCDDVRFKRKDVPDAWVTVDKAGEAMFRSYPYFEFIPGTKGDAEPIRYGDFVIDIDTGDLACQAAIKVIDWFQEIYAVDHGQWRVYLSGKKGIHLELPATIMGSEDGHVLLPLAYKRLAKDIEGELAIKLDTSMYNRGTGKPYRQPNVMRDCGTCKRQIISDDLYEIEDEEGYKSRCSEPGEVWQPEYTSCNELLAQKVDYYLKEAVKAQDDVKATKALTDDEIDRLAINVPDCIHVLANLTDMGKTSNTFNDVAMQLTAYAITVGMMEEAFVGAASVFIENYPSHSLDNNKKRYDNCRARFRNMAVNGNQHSCGGIKALGFHGFDCKQCKAMPNGPPMTSEVMSSEDVKKSQLSLCIPDDVLYPGGLISLGVNALRQPGLPNIPQYNLPVVLTTIANALAGKITCKKVWPNLFNIKVGPTSSGKSTSDEEIMTAINGAGIDGFYGVTDFASGPALMRSIAERSMCLVVIDEATSLFRRYDRADPTSDGKRDALLEIFSKSGGKIKRAYSDGKNTIEIERPCVSLTGNATPVILDAIRQEDFDTGTMQRFDFWCYDGPNPERGCPDTPDNALLGQFAEGIRGIVDAKLGDGNMRNEMRVPVNVGITEKGLNVLADWSQDVTARSNAAGSDGERGIISRQYHLAIKYAMIHMAGTRPAQALALPLDERDIEYGKKVAWMLGDWKINVLRDRVTTGDFHKSCEVFKQAIISAMRNGKRPTFKIMAHRRPELKNWKRKDSEEIISVLVKRGEVLVDESKKTTAYFLAKQGTSP